MGFFNFFKPKTQDQPISYTLLKTDMHSHLIPGIDDGAHSMDETIAMLAKFESLGYSKVITTPHVYSDFYKNTPTTILGGLAHVQRTAKQLGLSIEIEAAAEYFCDDYFLSLIEKGEVLTINDQYVLMEFPFLSGMADWQRYVFAVQSLGFTPIIAHFERYVYWHGSVDIAKEMRSLGAKIQLNINSLSGHYGPEVRKQCERMIDARVVDFAASDCHRIQHLLTLENMANSRYLRKLIETNVLLNDSL